MEILDMLFDQNLNIWEYLYLGWAIKKYIYEYNM